MELVQIIATFDSAEVAGEISQALNNWFQWLFEPESEDMPDFFEDFGVSKEEYNIDLEADTDWEDPPIARDDESTVIVEAYTLDSREYLKDFLENLGAFESEILDE